MITAVSLLCTQCVPGLTDTPLSLLSIYTELLELLELLEPTLHSSQHSPLTHQVILQSEFLSIQPLPFMPTLKTQN